MHRTRLVRWWCVCRYTVWCLSLSAVVVGMQATKTDMAMLKHLGVVSVKAGRTLLYKAVDVVTMFRHWKTNVPNFVNDMAMGKVGVSFCAWMWLHSSEWVYLHMIGSVFTWVGVTSHMACLMYYILLLLLCRSQRRGLWSLWLITRARPPPHRHNELLPLWRIPPMHTHRPSLPHHTHYITLTLNKTTTNPRLATPLPIWAVPNLLWTGSSLIHQILLHLLVLNCHWLEGWGQWGLFLREEGYGRWVLLFLVEVLSKLTSLPVKRWDQWAGFLQLEGQGSWVRLLRVK